MRTCLDLFCGAGFASLGLKRAGLEVIGIDNWDLAVESHNANGIKAVQADVNIIEWSAWETPDLMWASPACQPFSSASGIHGKGQWDERDGFPGLERAVKVLMPPILIVENVKGLSTGKNKPHLEAVLSSLRELGYTVEHQILNSANYGVPQTRERVFIVAVLDGTPRWPEETHAKDPQPELFGDTLKPWVTMEDALGWHERVGFPRKDDTGTSPTPYRERDMRKANEPAFTLTEKARSWVRIPEDWWRGRPSTTVCGDPRIGRPGHKDRDKGESFYAKASTRVTVEEALILQGMPSDWILAGPKTKQFLAVGNGVPPIWSQRLAEVNLRS